MSFIHKPPSAVALSMQVLRDTVWVTPSLVLRSKMASSVDEDHPHFEAWSVAKARSSSDQSCTCKTCFRDRLASSSRRPSTCTYFVPLSHMLRNLHWRSSCASRPEASKRVPAANASSTARVMQFLAPSECDGDFGVTLALMYTAIVSSSVLALASLVR